MAGAAIFRSSNSLCCGMAGRGLKGVRDRVSETVFERTSRVFLGAPRVVKGRWEVVGGNALEIDARIDCLDCSRLEGAVLEGRPSDRLLPCEDGGTKAVGEALTRRLTV
jgi:hypothetical protein